MSNVTVRKFPVTAPDGTEYRVKITEDNNFIEGQVVDVTIYTPRKRFGYRRLYCARYCGFDFVTNPDFVQLFRRVLADYAAKLERDAVERRKQAEFILRKQAALDRFAEWDGKITEVVE